MNTMRKLLVNGEENVKRILGESLGHFELLVLLALRGADTNGEPAALFVPIAFSLLERQDFGDMYNNGVPAAVQPGVSLAKARAELDTLVTTLADRYPPILARTAHRAR